MKKILMTTAAALAVTLGAASAGAATKACWIYVGPIGDFGWSYQHHQGLEAVKKEYGDKVETVYVENVPEADSERAIERLARDGCNIIFTTSFGFMEPTLKVAKKFPDVKFEHATGYKTADNVGTYNAKFHEGRYVIGQIAAKMSKTGTAGYIVSFPIPEVVSGINAFMLGAQSVNPDFKVKIVWANTWFDPGKEADAAKVLLSQGADITVQHTDSDCTTADCPGARKIRLRPSFGHDQVRTEGPTDGDCRQLGTALHQERQGRHGWHLEVRSVLGRHGRWRSGHGCLHQHAGRRGQDGDRNRGSDQDRQAQSVWRQDHQAGWNRGRCC